MPQGDNYDYYIGAPFFNEYYVSISAQRYEDSKLMVPPVEVDYLNVGIGPINLDVCLGDIVYNKYYSGYDANKIANDISSTIPGVDMHFTNNTC